MASFTDNPQALTNFNPYIKQLPVEEMIDVGKRRQAAHDEGVQKIQAQVENIAGLDVVREVDKAYLQSKVNQLGNNLRSVAAGDFSNFQLVNSVGGMTKQLANDKGIANAVASAGRYRKEVANMDTAVKEGKSSIANQWVFGKDSSDWLNSSDIDQAYNTKYQPYIDVNKKWMDVMKSLHPDLVEQDIPYEKDANGNIDYSKTAAAMQRVSKETVSAEKIANALSASLAPEELNQLNIEGRYTFRGQTPLSLASMSETKYASQVATNNARIKDLEGLVSLSASNPSLQKKAQDSIESIKAQNEALKTNHVNELQIIATNPELAKGIIYKNGAVAQFATANSWEHNKSNLLSNPVLEAEHWEKNNALDKAKFGLSVRAQNFNEWKDKQDLELKKANLGLNQQELALKIAKEQADKYGLAGNFESYGGSSTKIKDPMTAMITDATSYSAAASAGIVDMVKAMPGTNSVQIKQALDKYQKGDPNWFKMGVDSRSIIPVTLRDKADEIIYNRKAATRLNIGIKQSIEEVENSPQMKANKAAVLNSVASLPSISVVHNGKHITFTKQEVLNYISKKESPTSIGGAGGLSLSFNQSYNQPLTNREKLIEKYTYGTNRGILNEYRDASYSKLKDFSNTKEKLLEESLLRKGSTFLPRQTSIAFGSGEGATARRTWEGVINTALAPYGNRLNDLGVTGGTEELTKDEYETAKQWVSSDKRDNIIYSKIEQGNKTFIQMTLGGKDILIPINRNSVFNLPMVDKGSPSPQYKDIVGAQMIGNGNTNPDNKFENCYFDKTNIKGTTLNIGADLVWNQSNNDKQYISLKLNTPIGYMPLMIEAPVDRNAAIQLIQGLNDKKIKETYLNNPSIPQEWKEVIKKL